MPETTPGRQPRAIPCRTNRRWGRPPAWPAPDALPGAAALLLLGLWLAGCAATDVPPRAIEPTGDVQNVHDPVIAQQGNRYFVFSTGAGIPMRCSDDLVRWQACGRVFEQVPAWVAESVPGVGDLWAPDISRSGGKWRLYYSASTFGKNRSAIGLATNATLDVSARDYAWHDEGLVLSSQPTDDYNAIDPNLALDKDGRPWLVFGSFWSGIKLVQLDPASGKPAAGARLHSLARRVPPDALEGPFIVRRGNYYYLFVSWDFCCQGTLSNYHLRVGRAQDITGPYVDRDGVPLLEGGGTLLLDGGARWRGTGHNGILVAGGTYWLVYHAYDAQAAGVPTLRIAPLSWDKDGWPSVRPEQ